MTPDPLPPPSGENLGPSRQRSIFIPGLGGRRPKIPIDHRRLESEAKRVMSAEGFAYVAGGAGTESTVRENRAAFERWWIVPRMLRDVSRRSGSVELFERRLPSPILLAPIGVLEMAHREADLAVARAASSLKVPMVFSSQGSYSMEACASVMGDAPRWFQLYWGRSNELAASFLRRAQACRCDAVVLTLDTLMLGWRPRDLELAFLPFLRAQGIAQYTSDPVFLAALEEVHETDDSGPRPPLDPRTLFASLEMAINHPGSTLRNLRSGRARAAVRHFVSTFSRPSLTWDDLSWLRDQTTLPLLLKGILHPDDAREAVSRGMDGLIVSNHGGRQVDGALGALDALPDVVQAVEGRVPILFDSGIRSGADVFKALALGARAILLGRPYVYGLALRGEEGVAEVVENLTAELDLTMGLAGCRSVSEVERERVQRGPPTVR